MPAEHNHNTPTLADDCPRCNEIVNLLKRKLYSMYGTPVMSSTIRAILASPVSLTYQETFDLYCNEIIALGRYEISDCLTIATKV